MKRTEPNRMSGIADYLPGGPLCPLPKDCTDAEYEAWLLEKWIKRAKP